MAAPIKPRQHTALKKTRFWAVPAIADDVAPKITEVNASGSFYFTCFVPEDYGGGWTPTFNKGAGLRLLCSGSTPETLNPTTFAGNDIVVVVDPQADASDNDKKAFEFFRDGFTGKLVRSLNVANDLSDAVTLGDFVDVAPVDITPMFTDLSSTDANGVFVARAGVAITGDVTTNVEVVAGS
jgi:hypothetical protein